MKRNESYMLREIGGVPYLLPFGQMIADQKRGIAINETGVYLWNLLEKEHSFEELLSACAEYYEILTIDSQGQITADFSALQADLKQFVGQLSSYGIFINDSHLAFAEPPMTEKLMQIGGLITKLIGPEEAFSKNFEKFYLISESSCITVHQTIRIHPRLPHNRQNGKVLLRNEELIVIENSEEFVLLFPTANQLYEATLTKDGTKADFYCKPPYTDIFQEDLFHAIRLVWLYLAQKNNMVVIHSASILYNKKAWLFSGPSGTGKSTHTNLWVKVFEQEATLLNGDLNLLAIEEGTPVIHGLPWCGTSGICDTKTYPLGGIILLKQAKENKVYDLTDEEKILSVTHRLISPSWTADFLDHNLCIIEKLIPEILVCRLCCTKDAEAAITMRETIDTYQNRKNE